MPATNRLFCVPRCRAKADLKYWLTRYCSPLLQHIDENALAAVLFWAACSPYSIRKLYLLKQSKLSARKHGFQSSFSG